MIMHEHGFARILILQGKDEQIPLHMRSRRIFREQPLYLHAARALLRLGNTHIGCDRIHKAPAGITHKGQQQYCQNDFAIHTFSPSAKSLFVCHLYSP